MSILTKQFDIQSFMVFKVFFFKMPIKNTHISNIITALKIENYHLTAFDGLERSKLFPDWNGLDGTNITHIAIVAKRKLQTWTFLHLAWLPQGEERQLSSSSSSSLSFSSFSLFSLVFVSSSELLTPSLALTELFVSGRMRTNRSSSKGSLILFSLQEIRQLFDDPPVCGLIF